MWGLALAPCWAFGLGRMATTVSSVQAHDRNLSALSTECLQTKRVMRVRTNHVMPLLKRVDDSARLSFLRGRVAHGAREFRPTSKMSHDHSGRAACSERSFGPALHFGG